jgi:hypothetical protein
LQSAEKPKPFLVISAGKMSAALSFAVISQGGFVIQSDNVQRMKMGCAAESPEKSESFSPLTSSVPTALLKFVELDRFQLTAQFSKVTLSA